MTRQGIAVVAANVVLALVLSVKASSAATEEGWKFNCCAQTTDGDYFCKTKGCWFFGTECTSTVSCNLTP